MSTAPIVEVGVLDRLLELERRRHQELHAPAQDLLEVAHAVDGALEDRHLGAHTERDDGRVVADHPAADHEHPAGSDAGHASEEDPAPALRLLELIGPRLRSETAGDLAHRREQRERPAVRLHRLVRDRGDAGLDERTRERLVGGDVEVREEREVLAKPGILGRDRLLDLEQQVSAPPDIVHGGDRRARTLVHVVREGASDARARLDDHLVAALDELARTRGSQRNPVLLRLDLLGDADPHARGTISRQRWARRAT